MEQRRCQFISCIAFLHAADEKRKNDVCEAHVGGTQQAHDDSGIGLTIREMPRELLSLLKNPVFFCQCIVTACLGALFTGLATFMSKLVITQFYETPSVASYLTGTFCESYSSQ